MDLVERDDCVYTDADIEMAQLQEAGDRISRLAAKGICAHGWVQGHPDGTVTCKDCGAVFASDEAHYEARREVLS